MATPKLTTTRTERAKSISADSIKFLGDGTAEMKGSKGIYIVSIDDCTCPDRKIKKNVCKHMERMRG